MRSGQIIKWTLGVDQLAGSLLPVPPRERGYMVGEPRRVGNRALRAPLVVQHAVAPAEAALDAGKDPPAGVPRALAAPRVALSVAPDRAERARMRARRVVVVRHVVDLELPVTAMLVLERLGRLTRAEGRARKEGVGVALGPPWEIR